MSKRKLMEFSPFTAKGSKAFFRLELARFFFVHHPHDKKTLRRNPLYFSIVFITAHSTEIDSNDINRNEWEMKKKSSITLIGKRNQIQHLFALKAMKSEMGSFYIALRNKIEFCCLFIFLLSFLLEMKTFKKLSVKMLSLK